MPNTAAYLEFFLDKFLGKNLKTNSGYFKGLFCILLLTFLGGGVQAESKVLISSQGSKQTPSGKLSEGGKVGLLVSEQVETRQVDSKKEPAPVKKENVMDSKQAAPAKIEEKALDSQPIAPRAEPVKKSTLLEKSLPIAFPRKEKSKSEESAQLLAVERPEEKQAKDELTGRILRVSEDSITVEYDSTPQSVYERIFHIVDKTQAQNVSSMQTKDVVKVRYKEIQQQEVIEGQKPILKTVATEITLLHRPAAGEEMRTW